jgi:hypothetical protein
LLSNLQCGASYHYRAIVSSTDAVTSSGDNTVTVAACDPGQIQFLHSSESLAPDSNGDIQLAVDRNQGQDGTASIQFATMPGTATRGVDYESAAGAVTWSDGEGGSKSITIHMLKPVSALDRLTLKVILKDPQPTAAAGSLLEEKVTLAAPTQSNPPPQQPSSSGGGGGALCWPMLICLIFLKRGQLGA